jgi:hypothetical protein
MATVYGHLEVEDLRESVELAGGRQQQPRIARPNGLEASA